MIVSPITQKDNVVCIFEQKKVPLFQNKVYKTREEAVNCMKLPVKLYQCLDTGFVFSGGFDPDMLDYNEDYQNEQGNSSYFQDHLENVFQLIAERDLFTRKVVEIGCGKGLFLDLMLERGINATGIDPTYEGESEYVIKDYYSQKYSHLKAGFIVLRHTLEHISLPYDFLKMIADANDKDTVVYIEIPTYEWIYRNDAVEDVFYEHCNYFTAKSIKALFHEAEVIPVFNDQYMGIFARLGSLKKREEIHETDIETYTNLFERALEHYKDLVSSDSRKMIWGAGAKGSTFLNLTDDKAEKVIGVIDINPRKQNRFIGGTGHQIYSPEILKEINVDEIIVVNKNYISEIDATIKKMGLTINLKTL